MSRTIVFIRHAQAGPGLRDHSRSLTTAGRDQAQEAATKLATYLTPGARVVASSARRTQETAHAIAQQIGSEVESRSELYVGGEDEVIAATIGAGDVVVVGHAPVIAYAAIDCASRISPQVAEKVSSQGCPTATAFVFSVPTDEEGADDWGQAQWVNTLITPARR
ncbi:MAG: phosphoglycerate mutase family protein [Actinomycetaceae bacterium]|nr:phosphoglycerate mutase family protein [Actinomycetaceae bacterium]